MSGACKAKRKAARAVAPGAKSEAEQNLLRVPHQRDAPVEAVKKACKRRRASSSSDTPVKEETKTPGDGDDGDRDHDDHDDRDDDDDDDDNGVEAGLSQAVPLLSFEFRVLLVIQRIPKGKVRERERERERARAKWVCPR